MISKKEKVTISLAVTNCAVRVQIDWIEVALSRKQCAIHFFCNYEKDSAGRSLATPGFAINFLKILPLHCSYDFMSMIIKRSLV